MDSEAPSYISDRGQSSRDDIGTGPKNSSATDNPYRKIPPQIYSKNGLEESCCCHRKTGLASMGLLDLERKLSRPSKRSGNVTLKPNGCTVFTQRSPPL
ncbi:hypothetical protein AG1IA_04162 [Rhizoctonia solani AG-1 IA]|uniref:Uncharacterized protein n=1 Tax=Thanatephorus cucumeris (strain AG1-IA) TaxID=983506 RepID=L8WYF5_THACA|nr:hypothetical protein AG1IA_04162 [Rhizoctonia solani AG-1 IA]